MDLDSLDIDRLRAGRGEMLVGSDLRYIPVVESTNDVARQLSGDLWQSGTVICTDFQSQGKGRRGRTWEVPAGTSLLLSIILESPAGVRPADFVMLASLAVCDAIHAQTGLIAELKWPNDVLIRGRKVAGILVEHVPDGMRRKVIIGMGINGNFDPSTEGLPGTATTLLAECGHPIDREDLFLCLVSFLDLWYRRLIVASDDVWGAWVNRLLTIGKAVVVFEDNRTWEGIATGARRDGGLIVQTQDGKVRTVYAADVSVRSVPNFTSN